MFYHACLFEFYFPPLGAGGLQGRPQGFELGRQSAAIISPHTRKVGFEYFIMY